MLSRHSTCTYSVDSIFSLVYRSYESHKIERSSQTIGLTLIRILRTSHSRPRRQLGPAICEKLELTISHQTNLNSLRENNREPRRCRARYGTSKQTAFNLPRNNLHFPVQRFRWEIYCEYACGAYEYEYEKIIMPTTARDVGSSQRSSSSFSFLFLSLSCPVSFPSISPYSSLLSLSSSLISEILKEARLCAEWTEKASRRGNR